MELRYALAVVAPAGAGAGREVALQLARAGAAVLVVDPDVAAADETARLLAPARTRAWVLQADVQDPEEAALVAHRARDLGGADVVVDLGEPASTLGRLLCADADVRRGPRSGLPVAVVRTSLDAPLDTPPGDVEGALLVQRCTDDAARTATEVVSRLRRC